MDRRNIDILEAENGYVVTWRELGLSDKEVLLCPDIPDVLREVERITVKWLEKD